MVVMQDRVAVETADASSVASQATSPTIVLDKEEAEVTQTSRLEQECHALLVIRLTPSQGERGRKLPPLGCGAAPHSRRWGSPREFLFYRRLTGVPSVSIILGGTNVSTASARTAMENPSLAIIRRVMSCAARIITGCYMEQPTNLHAMCRLTGSTSHEHQLRKKSLLASREPP